MRQKILLASGSLFLALLVSEILLRAALPQIFEVHPRGIYVEDAEVGYVLRPAFTGWLARPEFRHPITINRIGLRGGDLRPRRANSFRIVCLGDSFTWGFGVVEAETFSAHLEEGLAGRFPGRDIQVLNAGVPGYGTADQLHFLQSRAAALDPDLVIVQFLPDNDFTENRAPARENIQMRDGMLITRTGGRDPFRDQPAWLRMLKWAKRHSHLASFVSERAGNLAMRAGLMENITTQGEDFTEDDERIAIHLLREIAATARRWGARTLFLLSPSQISVIAERQPPSRAAIVVENAAGQAASGFIDLTPLLRARPNRLALYYSHDGHWTAAGHAAVADILTDYIVSRKAELVPSYNPSRQDE